MKKIKEFIKKIRDPKIMRVIIILGVALVIIVSFVFYQKLRDRVNIEDSLVSAPIITVSPLTPGTLFEMRAYEGEMVKKGDSLAVVGTQSLNAYNDGLVISTNQAVGSLVSSASNVVQMIDLSTMRITGTIDENKGLDKLKVGQAVSFTVDALPNQKFWGYVDEISQTAKQTQLQFSVSSERPTQQFYVYAKFDAAKYPQIKNGMSAKMTVYTNTP